MSVFLRVAVAVLFHSLPLNACEIGYVISPPRSRSVAFLRMMQAHGHFKKIFNEPSFSVKALLHPATKHYFTEAAPHNFPQVRDIIEKEAISGPLFVKEMASSVRDTFIENKEFFSNPKIRILFLLRNPHHAIISLYKRCADLAFCAPSACGYQYTYELFTSAKNLCVRAPLVVFSEDLCNRPVVTARKVCKYLGIPYQQKMLEWQDLGQEFDGKAEWHEMKTKEFAHHWHGQAIRSTGFEPPSSYETDEHGNPTFSEIENVEHRVHLIIAYHENKKYYDLLKAEATIY